MRMICHSFHSLHELVLLCNINWICTSTSLVTILIYGDAYVEVATLTSSDITLNSSDTTFNPCDTSISNGTYLLLYT